MLTVVPDVAAAGQAGGPSSLIDQIVRDGVEPAVTYRLGGGFGRPQ